MLKTWLARFKFCRNTGSVSFYIKGRGLVQCDNLTIETSGGTSTRLQKTSLHDICSCLFEICVNPASFNWLCFKMLNQQYSQKRPPQY